MNKVYLCWQTDNSILGIASTEEQAQEMCSQLGEAYMEIEMNKAQRESIETTSLCKHHVKEGFLSYDDCISYGYTFIDKA